MASSIAMAKAAKRRIAIVGGGVSALTCAHYLTRTAELRARYDVVVYQLGWRLGGKGASGRNLDPKLGKRAEEHGLHIWFGFYENAFALMREAYAGWKGRPARYDSWDKAFVGQDRSSHGELRNGRHVTFSFKWPDNDDEPGTGQVLPTPIGVVTGLLGLLHEVVEGLFNSGRTHGPGGVERLSFAVLGRMRGLLETPRIPKRVRVRRAEQLQQASMRHRVGAQVAGLLDRVGNSAARGAQRATGILSVPGRALDAAGRVVQGAVGHRLRDDASLGVFDRFRWLFRELRQFGDVLSDGFDRDDLYALDDLLAYFHTEFRSAFEELFDADDELRRGWYVIDLGTALIRGLVNRKYGLLDDDVLDLNRLDEYELRQWLIDNGADPDIVRDAFPLRMLYDAAFQYEGGHIERPNYAAGVGIRVLIRICLTYKGHIFYKMRMAMGEAVVTPIYEVLKQNKVRFEFFTKVERLDLDANGNIATMHVERQARTQGGATYEPTFKVHEFPCWPSEPLWDQLEHGEQLRDAGVNFESHWCEVPGAKTEALQLGRDFDEVVLAVPVGVYKQLNHEPGMCDALIDRSEGFRKMCETLGLVPTQAVQLWLDRDMKALGSEHEKPAFIPAAEPLDTWAAVPEVLETEDWPESDQPKALAFFCGVLGTELYRRPATETDTPALARDAVRSNAVQWFDRYTYSIWPRATREREPDGLDYDALFVPKSLKVKDRLDAQYIRANVDPTECCVGSHAGTIRARPTAGQFRAELPNLVLTGAWIRTGMNTTCVESAVMAGMQAAKVLGADPGPIVGNDFLQRW